MFPKKDSCPEIKKEMRIRTFFVFVNKYIVLSWAAIEERKEANAYASLQKCQADFI
ncbi:hypothetical protein B4168_1474 [Anoxybacillus flavithermus]|nr:hypothetical protein B4168_1474 [Anoxybacillus flavithermus]OAO84130.1 hypothetical protein GT23_3665 [Parageobacillus thermoglucosidasius]